MPLVADDLRNFLKEPGELATTRGDESLFARQQGDSQKPSAEPQMTVICLFVSGVFFSWFQGNHWVGLTFASGVIGSGALLAFIASLQLGYIGITWATYGGKKFLHEYLHDLSFVDRIHSAAKQHLQ